MIIVMSKHRDLNITEPCREPRQASVRRGHGSISASRDHRRQCERGNLLRVVITELEIATSINRLGKGVDFIRHAAIRLAPLAVNDRYGPNGPCFPHGCESTVIRRLVNNGMEDGREFSYWPRSYCHQK
jgi:hypothetical protein